MGTSVSKLTVIPPLTRVWVLASLCFVATAQMSHPIKPVPIETFVWRYGTNEFGSLAVPSDFTADTENYREGIVTRLHYRDGSCIVLQSGFLYRIPMFQDPEHILDSSKKLIAKTVRRGHYDHKTEVWGEDDYAPRKPTHQGSLLETISPNLGFEHVPRGRGREFARALESFVPTH